MNNNLHAALILLACAVSVHGQATESRPAQRITEMYNKDGWKIPSLSTAQAKERDLTFGVVNDVQVTVDRLEPKEPADRLLLFAYDTAHSDRIEIFERDVDVLKILRFRANGRIFAYRVFAGQVAIEGTKRVALGTMEIVAYYDLDGSGRFTVMRYASDIPFKLIVPEWLKKIDTAK